jgi:hypothetical protein
MGGLTAPLVCGRLPVDRLVLLNAMIPRPGETGGEWWTATGHERARTEAARTPAGRWTDDEVTHDVRPRSWPLPPTPFAQSGTPLPSRGRYPVGPACDPSLAAWGTTGSSRGLPGRVPPSGLGLPVEELPGGTWSSLSRRAELAERLVGSASGTLAAR